MKPLHYILALALTLETLAFIESHKQSTADIATLTAENTTLQRSIDTLTEENEQLNKRIGELAEQIRNMQEKEREVAKASRGERLVSLGKWRVTGYCKCSICTGKFAKNRPNGIVYGRDGKTELIAGISAAADLPFGTRLLINGKVYVVQDKPAEWVIKANGGKIVDLYMKSHSEAWDVGNEQVEVWEIE